MILLDTNIIIDHLRLAGRAASALMRVAELVTKDEVAISVISVQELYEGKSTRARRPEQELLAVISPLRILPYTFEVAQLAGQIARDGKRLIELADAAVAATAIINQADFYTLNQRDFHGIAGLNFWSEPETVTDNL